MSYKLDTINYKGYDIEIYQDEDAEDPDTWNEDTFLAYDHRQFSTYPKGMTPSDIQDMYDTYTEDKHLFWWNGSDFWIIPIFAYIHSGVSLYLNRASAMRFEPTGFDTSFKGFYLVKNGEDWNTLEKAYEIAEGSI